MATIAEQGSRALEATSDLNDLLRLAHEALHRLQNEVHGDTFDEANGLSQHLQTLRQKATTLEARVQQSVRSTGTGPVAHLVR
ncbi:MAG: hypothetical protein WCC36_09635 [Gammaproteobacteria bacterium]